jgi:NACalpha-BTF3-like transcription factor
MENNLNYISFNEFVVKIFREKNIEMNDLNTLNENEFYKKYDITKKNLHNECVDTYKRDYPDDYNKHVERYREKINNQVKEYNEKKQELINILMRQTTYSEEEAKNILEKNNYNISLALKEYLQPLHEKDIKETKITTTNQKIYKEIRDFMNNNYELYEKRKQISKKNIEIKNQINDN